jgi:hypothetical protein
MPQNQKTDQKADQKTEKPFIPFYQRPPVDVEKYAHAVIDAYRKTPNDIPGVISKTAQIAADSRNIGYHEAHTLAEKTLAKYQQTVQRMNPEAARAIVGNTMTGHYDGHGYRKDREQGVGYDF